MKNWSYKMIQQQIQTEKTQMYEQMLNKAVEDKRIDDWNIHVDVVRRNNIYIERDYKVESILNSKREEYSFTVYKNYDDGTIGESSFSLSESDGADEFASLLDDAIFTCSHSKSKEYKLPSADDDEVNDETIDYSSFYDTRFFDDFEGKGFSVFLANKLELFKKKIAEGMEDNVDIEMNYLEFFNKITSTSIKTSKKIEKDFNKNGSYLEFVLTAKDKKSGEEFEHIVYESINNIYSFDFESFFEMHVRFAKDSLKAGTENSLSDFEGKVILSGFAANDFFVPSPPSNPLVLHAGARLKFMKISGYEIGKEVVESKRDKITIYSNPLLMDNASSMPCDGLGISAKRLCLIKDSVFRNYFASKQYADYLGVKATGPLGAIEVDGGSRSAEELYSDSDEMMEIVSFAWFNPDSASGNFSAEIRLGYRIKDGKKIPFKGGLFSGNVFDVLKDVEFSKEKINVPGYFGPKVLKFYQCQIVGM